MKKTLIVAAILLIGCYSKAGAQIVTAQDFKDYDLSTFDTNGDGEASYVEAA
ncbi:MAG: hypothetical protein M0P00_06970 [Bacteroidaceae bacterium]|nr:hypothetical protein [Bacteroidaceae bacterium]